MPTVDEMRIVMDAETARMVSRLDEANRLIARFESTTQAKLKSFDGHFARSGAMLGRFQTSLATLGAYVSTREILDYANAWTRVERNLASSQQVFGVALMSADELTQLAGDARIDVEAYGKTYVRTAAAIRDYGMGSDEAARITTTLAKALKLGSASASEQASVLMQFSQALQKGRLDGDEFRTVMENAGVIQELLAERLGVSKGAIISMAKEGKLGIGELAGAMLDGGAQVDRIFNAMPATVDEAMTVMSNAMSQYIGKLNKATGATQGVVDVTAIAARNLETIGDLALVTGAALATAYAPGMIANVTAFGVAAAAAVSPVGWLLATIGGGYAAFKLFGDNIKVTGDGVVSLTDRINALTAAIRANGSEVNAQRGFKGFNPRGAMGMPQPEKGPKLSDERYQAALRQWTAKTSIDVQAEIEMKRGQPAPGVSGKAQERFEREMQQIRDRTQALVDEAAVIGNTSRALDKARASRELMNAAEEAARNGGPAVTPEMLADIDRLAEKYADVGAKVEFLKALQSGRDAGDAINDEIALTGKLGYELAFAKEQQQLLNEAKRAGVELTPERLAEINHVAAANAAARTYLETLQDIRDTSRDALKGFISDMVQGKSASEAFAGVLDNIAAKLVDMAANNLIEAALGGLLGPGTSGGGILSGLLSGTRAFGGDVQAGKAYQVGERGPEWFVPSIPGAIVPNGAAGGGQVIHLAIDARHATPDAVAALKNEMPGMILETMREAKSRGLA